MFWHFALGFQPSLAPHLHGKVCIKVLWHSPALKDALTPQDVSTWRRHAIAKNSKDGQLHCINFQSPHPRVWKCGVGPDEVGFPYAMQIQSNRLDSSMYHEQILVQHLSITFMRKKPRMNWLHLIAPKRVSFWYWSHKRKQNGNRTSNKYIHAENNTVEQHVGPPWIQPQNSQLRNAASKWVIARHTYSILQYMFDFVLSRKGYRVMHLQNDASSEMLVKKPWCRHGAHHIGSGSRCRRIRRLLTKQCL